MKRRLGSQPRLTRAAGLRQPKIENNVRKLARLLGIETSFTSMDGSQVKASPEAIRAILKMFDLNGDTDKDASESLRLEAAHRWSRVIEPVLVCWDGQPGPIRIRLPEAVQGPVEWEITLEQGSRHTEQLALEGSPVTRRVVIKGARYLEYSVSLAGLANNVETVRASVSTAQPGVEPARGTSIPFGCHGLEIRAGAIRSKATLICAPSLSYSPDPPRKTWGVFAPVYALRSGRNWGAGNFTDLRRLNEFIAKCGGSFVATLPLTAAFLGSPVCEPSPYSPASRLYWNEFFLDPESLVEYKASPAARRIINSREWRSELKTLGASPYVDYRRGMRLRRQVLAEMAKAALKDPVRRKALEAFDRNRPRLKDYAEFRAVCDRLATSWHVWEPRLRFGKLQPEDYRQDDFLYHRYVQWAAEEQFSHLAESCRKSGNSIYLDLSLGVSADSYDLWRERDYFAPRASVGAPPDAFFSKGQDWGFAPLHPLRIRELGYAYIREYLQFQMRHASMLRIDHVMGLHRLYWIPHGFSGTDGAYVRYPAEEFYALLNLESHRTRTVLVGENLGTVPPEVNTELRRRRFRTMYVLPFEQNPGARRTLPQPPALSVASLNTHDMPAFAAHVTGADIQARVELGLLRKEDARQERARRQKMMRQLRSFLDRNGFRLPKESAKPEDLLKACIRWLAQSPAETVLITLEDFWGELEPQNVPGTGPERPNWKRKMRLSLEEIEQLSSLSEFLKTLTRDRLASQKL